MRGVKRNKKGIALVLSMIFLVILSMMGVWLISQAQIDLKVSGSLRRYEKAFQWADGACALGIKYLRRHLPPPPSWDPTKQEEVSSLPSYLTSNHAKVIWKGYNSRPYKGWELNWSGYSRFHQYQYLSQGEATAATAHSKVLAIVVRIAH